MKLPLLYLLMLFCSQVFAQYSVGLNVNYVECASPNTDSMGTSYFAYKVGKPFRGSQNFNMEVWHVSDSYRRIQNNYYNVNRRINHNKLVTVNNLNGLILQYTEKQSGFFNGKLTDKNGTLKVLCRKY